MDKSFTIEAVGQVLYRDTQAFKCVAIRPVTRKDGTPSRYAVLRGKCADCGAEFECTTAMSGAVFQPNRRCDKHKAAGLPVGAPRAKERLAELQREVDGLRADLAEMRRAHAAEAKRRETAERKLARYELTDAEGRRFAAYCAQMARERRAHLARASGRAAGVFD